LHKPDDEHDEGTDDWYQLVGPDSMSEEMPQADRQDDAANTFDDITTEEEERDPIPFGEDGVSFLRNILQHGVFLGIGALILMILQYVRQR
jgi:hypothetical protein